MLTDHRRGLVYAFALLACTLFILLAVGRHPPGRAPETTLAPIGALDDAIWSFTVEIRTPILTGVSKALSVIGGGIVTIPLRAVVAVLLALRRYWRRTAAWVLTWIGTELAIGLLKPYFHRGRPPSPLVETVGYSFPSGHAVAGAAIGVCLVLVTLPPGRERRAWEWIAAAFAFVMAFSRVYLHAHWPSDVVAGVLLGTGIAIGSAALVTEIRDRALRGRHEVPTDLTR